MGTQLDINITDYDIPVAICIVLTGLVLMLLAVPFAFSVASQCTPEARIQHVAQVGWEPCDPSAIWISNHLSQKKQKVN